MNNEKCKLKDRKDVTIDYTAPKFFGAGGVFPSPDSNEKIKEFSVKQDKIIIRGEQKTLCFIKATSEVIKRIEIEICCYIGKPIKSIEEIEI